MISAIINYLRRDVLHTAAKHKRAERKRMDELRARIRANGEARYNEIIRINREYPYLTIEEKDASSQPMGYGEPAVIVVTIWPWLLIAGMAIIVFTPH